MKRLVLLLFCCALLGGSVCSAKIFEKQDEFTGGKIIISDIKCVPEKRNSLSWITLKKNIEIKENEYQLSAAMAETDDSFALSNKGIQINIDKNYLYDIPIVNRKDISLKSGHVVIADYQANAEIIEKRECKIDCVKRNGETNPTPSIMGISRQGR